MTFSDVLASMDAVISKPGFGILSDCIANKKPLIYADRSNFLEYPILVAAIEKYIKHVHIPTAKLYRGDLEESLHAIGTAPEPPEELPLGGDRIAANRIAQFL
jgi:L-arabinokinase